MQIEWENGFEIRVSIKAGEALISANQDGLVSLAYIMLALAKENPGAHVHLDESNSLEDGSCALVLEKTG